jgi:hypothetical protein
VGVSVTYMRPKCFWSRGSSLRGQRGWAPAPQKQTRPFGRLALRSSQTSAVSKWCPSVRVPQQHKMPGARARRINAPACGPSCPPAAATAARSATTPQPARRTPKRMCSSLLCTQVASAWDFPAARFPSGGWGSGPWHPRPSGGALQRLLDLQQLQLVLQLQAGVAAQATSA